MAASSQEKLYDLIAGLLTAIQGTGVPVDIQDASITASVGSVTETNSGAIKTAVEALSALITSGAFKVVLQAGTAAFGKLAANAGVIIGAVEIAASQTLALAAGSASIGSVDVNLPSAIGTQATKTDLSNTTPFNLASHSGLKVGIRITNQETTAANVIYVGDASVSATQYLQVIYPGQTSDWLPCSNSNAYYVLAAVNNSDFTYGYA